MVKARPPVSQGQHTPASVRSTNPSEDHPNDTPQCDLRGNILPFSGQRDMYLRLRSTAEDPETRIYKGTWAQMKAISVPLYKLPHKVYGYRKTESGRPEDGEQDWYDQGHQRPIPIFNLG